MFDTQDNEHFTAGFVLAQNAVNEKGDVILLRGVRLEVDHVKILRGGQVSEIRVLSHQKSAMELLDPAQRKKVDATVGALFIHNRKLNHPNLIWLKMLRLEQLALELLEKGDS